MRLSRASVYKVLSVYKVVYVKCLTHDASTKAIIAPTVVMAQEGRRDVKGAGIWIKPIGMGRIGRRGRIERMW